MNSDPKHTNPEPKPKKKRRLWPWITLLVIIILAVSLRMAMRADWVMDYISGQIENAVAETTGAEFRIGSLRGDLWSHLTITNIRMDKEGPVLSVDTVDVRYSLWPLITSRTLQVNDLSIKNPNVNLEQYSDSTWNFMLLIPPGDETPDAEDDDGLPINVVLDNLSVDGGEIHVKAPLMLPDELLAIRNLSLNATGSVIDDEYEARLQQLSLKIDEGRLPDGINLETGLAYEDDVVTLERLVLSTGRTLLESKAMFDVNEEIVDGDLSLKPLSAADLNLWLDEPLTFDELVLHFRFGGSLSDISTGLEITIEDQLSMKAGARIAAGPIPGLSEFSIEIDQIDVPSLIPGDTLYAGFSTLNASGSGFIPFDDVESATFDLEWLLTGLFFEEYSIPKISGTAGLSQQNITLASDVELPDGTLNLAAAAQQIFGDMPGWNLEVDFRDINPGLWANDETLDGAVDGNLKAEGSGFDPRESDKIWKAELLMSKLVAGIYEMDEIRMLAEIDQNNVKLESSGGYIENEFSVNALVGNWDDIDPEYSFELLAKNINFSELLKIEELVSDFNAEIKGSGKGFDPETAVAELSFFVSRSVFLDQQVDTMFVQTRLEDQILHVDESRLESQFAEAYFTARQNIADLTDIENRLDFDAEIKNISSFNVLAGVDTLYAKGTINGQIRPGDTGVPKLDGGFNLTNVIADSLYLEEVQGTFSTVFDEELDVAFAMDITSPQYGANSLQDIRFESELKISEIIEGWTKLAFLTAPEEGLFHEADLRIDDQITLLTTRLDLIESDVELNLKDPFQVVIYEGAVSMDTLRLGSNNGAYLNLWAAVGEDEVIEAYFSSGEVDIGMLQAVILDEIFVEGELTSSAKIRLAGEELELNADLAIDRLRNDLLPESRLSLTAEIREHRLTSLFEMHLADGDKLVISEMDLPFRLGDPATFPEEFFEKPVSGYVRVPETNLEKFEQTLRELQLADVSGNISFLMELAGEAGNPDVKIETNFRDGRLSGVDVDSATFRLDYDHPENRMYLESDLNSLGQRVFSANGSLPLHIDMVTFEISEPDGTDEVDINVNTTNFDLAAFNDFLDRDVARGLRGTLNMEMELTGMIDDLQPNGSISLENGQVYIVENNITLRNMRAGIQVEPERLIIERIAAESSGSFRLEGEIGIKSFVPERFDLKATMRNFRVYNTRDIDMFVSLDSELTGPLVSPSLTGNVRLERGNIFLDNFGEQQIERVTLDDEEEDMLFEELFEALAIEMNLAVNRRVFVRNRNRPELELELDGDLDVIKEKNGELQMFGTMGTVRGSATQFGRRFTLEEGELMFSGPPDNPEFNIRLLYELRRPDDIKIWYVIRGTAEEPEFIWESDPSMELADILSYTIFGRPVHDLEGWERGIIGGAGGDGSVATAALDLILDRLESIAADRLGIDILEIEQGGGGSGTRVKAGKYITDRLFLAVIQELGRDRNSQVLIEYLLRRNLELHITGSEDYRTGVDILWRRDY